MLYRSVHCSIVLAKFSAAVMMMKRMISILDSSNGHMAVPSGQN